MSKKTQDDIRRIAKEIGEMVVAKNVDDLEKEKQGDVGMSA